MHSDDNNENDYRRYIVLSIIFIVVMIINYYLIFISDTTIKTSMLFSEDGSIEQGLLIPRNSSSMFLSLKNYHGDKKTYLIIKGINGSCLIKSFLTNNTYEIVLNKTNNNYELVSYGLDIFYVESTSNGLVYRYEVYSVEKPLLFLALVAFILSFVGLGLGIFIFFKLLVRRYMSI